MTGQTIQRKPEAKALFCPWSTCSRQLLTLPSTHDSGVRFVGALLSCACNRSRCTFGKPFHIGYHQDGSFASGYCDVVLPTPAYTSTSRELVYVDLYIDVVVREDGSVYTKDQEVFDRAALRYPVVEESRQKSFAVLDWLEKHAKRWTGPFAVVPKQLSRTDFESLSSKQVRAAWRR